MNRHRNHSNNTHSVVDSALISSENVASSSWLLRHTPTWYHTPLSQTVALGGVFFLVFTSYTTIQFYARTTYGPDLAANAVAAVYGTFTLGSGTLAPSITDRLGARTTLLLGILGGYAVFVVVSLVYFVLMAAREEEGEKDDMYTTEEGAPSTTHHSTRTDAMLQWMVVISGGILGLGAALVWTAHGQLVLDYGSVGAASGQKKQQVGKLMGVFWGVFQCSSLVGGAITFVYFSRPQPTGSVWLYFIFLAFILLGALSTQLLLPPHLVASSIMRQPGDNDATQTDRKEEEEEPGQGKQQYSMLVDIDRGQSSCGSNHENSKAQVASEVTQLLEQTLQPTMSNALPLNIPPQKRQPLVAQEPGISRATLRVLRTRPYLLVLFFYTGYNQPYQQATFGNRFFTKRMIGIELILFHLMEIAGGICSGKILDREFSSSPSPPKQKLPYTCRRDKHASSVIVPAGAGVHTTECRDNTLNQVPSYRRSAIISLTIFLVINIVGNIIAYSHEHQLTIATNATIVVATDIMTFWKQAMSPSLAFCCWGFADAQIQVYCYWFMGMERSDRARAVGVYKCLQSLGVCLGFLGTSRLTPMHQLILSASLHILGTALAYFQLPRR